MPEFHRLPRVGGERVLVVRKLKTEVPVVLTIGHSTRTWKDFLDLLRAHRVKHVIDNLEPRAGNEIADLVLSFKRRATRAAPVKGKQQRIPLRCPLSAPNLRF